MMDKGAMAELQASAVAQNFVFAYGWNQHGWILRVTLKSAAYEVIRKDIDEAAADLIVAMGEDCRSTVNPQ